MNVSSLRPERSASANSATPAWEVRVVFYLKRLFCQIRSAFTLKAGNKSFFNIVIVTFLAKLYCQPITVLLGDAPFCLERRYTIHIKQLRKELPMLFVLAVVVVLLLLVLAGADLFVAQYNSDELSNMGVQER